MAQCYEPGAGPAKGEMGWHHHVKDWAPGMTENLPLQQEQMKDGTKGAGKAALERDVPGSLQFHVC